MKRRVNLVVLVVFVTLSAISTTHAISKKRLAVYDEQAKTFFSNRSYGLIDASYLPFELALFSPFQIGSGNTTVGGMRLSALYAFNKAVYGLDLGIICDSEYSGGLQANACNWVRETQSGIGVSLANVAERNLYGAQLGVYNQVGILDEAWIFAGKTKAKAAQFGVVNLANCDFAGGQFGVVNISDKICNGLQIGVVNGCWGPDEVMVDYYDTELTKRANAQRCLQIGFINFNPRGFLPLMLGFNF